MDKNNKQKNNKTPETKPKQDSFRPWLKLIPAAAVFAAVCVTCYQANKSPVETSGLSCVPGLFLFGCSGYPL